MSKPVVWALKALLVLFFAVCLMAQVWAIPSLAREVATHFPGTAHLEVVGIVGAVVMVLCAQVVLVCLWRLLSMAAADRVFQAASFRWVDAVIVSLGVFALLSAVAFVLSGTVGILAPGLVLVLSVATFGSLAAMLLVVVMRGLLVKATRLEGEMAEVV
ncbi:MULTISPECIES: DUF2975 domain-containing protein [Microbacterium]|uniref:DUF2975 domain-containing protein n=1 Tax=Microbacterium TaxID=33882 RepID=UPI00300FF8E2